MNEDSRIRSRKLAKKNVHKTETLAAQKHTKIGRYDKATENQSALKIWTLKNT